MERVLILLDDSHIELAEKAIGHEYKEFRSIPHVIIGTENGSGAVGVELYEQYVWITFMFGDGKISTHKELASIGKWLFKFYTVERGKPVLYTGNRNDYKNNSIELAPKLWQLLPTCYN